MTTALTARTDLSATEKLLLSFLSANDDGTGVKLSDAEIGEQLGMHRGTVANHLTKLRKGKHLYSHSFDGRRRSLSLSSSLHQNVKAGFIYDKNVLSNCTEPSSKRESRFHQNVKAGFIYDKNVVSNCTEPSSKRESRFHQNVKAGFIYDKNDDLPRACACAVSNTSIYNTRNKYIYLNYKKKFFFQFSSTATTSAFTGEFFYHDSSCGESCLSSESGLGVTGEAESLATQTDEKVKKQTVSATVPVNTHTIADTNPLQYVNPKDMENINTGRETPVETSGKPISRTFTCLLPFDCTGKQNTVCFEPEKQTTHPQFVTAKGTPERQIFEEGDYKIQDGFITFNLVFPENREEGWLWFKTSDTAEKETVLMFHILRAVEPAPKKKGKPVFEETDWTDGKGGSFYDTERLWLETGGDEVFEKKASCKASMAEMKKRAKKQAQKNKTEKERLLTKSFAQNMADFKKHYSDTGNGDYFFQARDNNSMKVLQRAMWEGIRTLNRMQEKPDTPPTSREFEIYWRDILDMLFSHSDVEEFRWKFMGIFNNYQLGSFEKVVNTLISSVNDDLCGFLPYVPNSKTTSKNH